jgi:hypothetical protein
MATMTMVRTETRTMTATELEEQQAQARVQEAEAQHQRLLRANRPYILNSVVYPTYAAAMAAKAGAGSVSSGAPPPPPPGGSQTVTVFEEPKKPRKGWFGKAEASAPTGPELEEEVPKKKVSLRRKLVANLKRLVSKGLGRAGKKT